VSDESPEAPGRVPGSYVPLVSKGIEITPTADMRFKKEEPLYAYFEVYEPQFAGQSATMVEAHLRILDANTGDVRIGFEPVNAAPYIKAGSSVICIGREINLASLSNGSYRLEVQTTNSTGKSTA
jgi:hypothetical protein